MEQNLYGIGELAALSGLSISALRFYNGAGVLLPAWVDPSTGYRKYAGDQLRPARLIARLRRVGMPLAEIKVVLAGAAEAGLAGKAGLADRGSADRGLADRGLADRGLAALGLAALDAHLRRLEDGLADARRELSTVRDHLATMENPMATIVLPVKSFLDAVAEVRFAASTNPELPMLCGVLLDLDTDQPALRLVASDRYRLAVSTVEPDTATGHSLAVLAPTAVIDALLAEFADSSGPLTVRLSADELTFSLPEKEIRGATLHHEFPDYQRLVRLEPGRQVPIAAADLRHAIGQAPTRTRTRDQDGAEYQVSVLTLDRTGALQVNAGDPQPDELAVGVNREFLLQALAAGRSDQLTLELGGSIGPLAIRNPGRDGSFSILMPIRL
ncbi:MAG: MerR family transcriptional regulator [Jatrophihabitantaceae bacterium]